MKPLYSPRPLILPSEQMTQAVTSHWSVLGRQVESQLSAFLRTPTGVSCLLTDRATTSLRLAFVALQRALDLKTVLVPRLTYRAAADAAVLAGADVRLNPRPDVVGEEDDAIWVPTTLGGSPVVASWLARPNVVVDAAHTGYCGMCRGIDPWRGFLVLSFFPTKPLGAWGGGALVGPTRFIEEIRSMAWPIEAEVASYFSYPAGLQSLGIAARLEDWAQIGPEQAGHRIVCQDLEERLEKYGYFRRWAAPVSPHVLSWTHPNPSAVDRLALAAKDAGYEVGCHYRPLDGWLPHEAWVTLPFIYPELGEELDIRLGRLCA